MIIMPTHFLTMDFFSWRVQGIYIAWFLAADEDFK